MTKQSTSQLFLLAAAVLIDEEEGKKAKGREERNLRCDHQIPRHSLLLPWQSPWQMIYFSGRDQGMITTTGFDNKSFATLLSLFRPMYNGYTPHSKDGQIKKLQPLKSNGLGRR